MATDRGSQAIVQSWKQEEVGEHIRKLEATIGAIRADVAHLAALKTDGLEIHADTRPTHRLKTKSIDDLLGIRSKKYKKVHLAVAGADLRSATGTTLCTWKLERAEFELVRPSSSISHARCKNCWRRVFVASEPGPSSASSSSS